MLRKFNISDRRIASKTGGILFFLAAVLFSLNVACIKHPNATSASSSSDSVDDINDPSMVPSPATQPPCPSDRQCNILAGEPGSPMVPACCPAGQVCSGRRYDRLSGGIDNGTEGARCISIAGIPGCPVERVCFTNGFNAPPTCCHPSTACTRLNRSKKYIGPGNRVTITPDSYYDECVGTD